MFLFVVWDHNFFPGCTQYIKTNHKASSLLPTNFGVLQCVPLFTLHLPLIIYKVHCFFLKYADDAVMGHLAEVFGAPLNVILGYSLGSSHILGYMSRGT